MGGQEQGSLPDLAVTPSVILNNAINPQCVALIFFMSFMESASMTEKCPFDNCDGVWGFSRSQIQDICFYWFGGYSGHSMKYDCEDNISFAIQALCSDEAEL